MLIEGFKDHISPSDARRCDNMTTEWEVNFGSVIFIFPLRAEKMLRCFIIGMFSLGAKGRIFWENFILILFLVFSKETKNSSYKSFLFFRSILRGMIFDFWYSFLFFFLFRNYIRYLCWWSNSFVGLFSFFNVLSLRGLLWESAPPPFPKRCLPLFLSIASLAIFSSSLLDLLDKLFLKHLCDLFWLLLQYL